jgi:hypothetical protein
MEDWGLHQTGKRQRLCYCTVQNPIARSLAREKGDLRNMHPDVIAQTEKNNERKKQNLSESNADLVGTLQKRQRDIGNFEAMQDVTKRLTWSAPLFNHGKVDSYGSKNAKILCHLVKELGNTKL